MFCLHHECGPIVSLLHVPGSDLSADILKVWPESWREQADIKLISEVRQIKILPT